MIKNERVHAGDNVWRVLAPLVPIGHCSIGLIESFSEGQTAEPYLCNCKHKKARKFRTESTSYEQLLTLIKNSLTTTYPWLQK